MHAGSWGLEPRTVVATVRQAIQRNTKGSTGLRGTRNERLFIVRSAMFSRGGCEQKACRGCAAGGDQLTQPMSAGLRTFSHAHLAQSICIVHLKLLNAPYAPTLLPLMTRLTAILFVVSSVRLAAPASAQVSHRRPRARWCRWPTTPASRITHSRTS
jgi:hypothetical protein